MRPPEKTPGVDVGVTAVIVDAGPIVAWLNRPDRYHEWAKAQFAALMPPLLTCEAAQNVGVSVDVISSPRSVSSNVRSPLAVPDGTLRQRAAVVTDSSRST